MQNTFKFVIACGIVIKEMKTKNLVISAKSIVNDEKYRKNIIQEAKKVQNNKDLQYAVEVLEAYKD